nr:MULTISPECIES: alpha/beta-hydrolase family protein [unclassified Rhodococcus (in: high G+C Gram-positive bacteria)]
MTTKDQRGRIATALWRWCSRFEPIGLVVGLVFYCWSMSPSLLPRPWYLQAVATGLSVACGYGVGVLVVWSVRRMELTREWPERLRRWGWYAIGAAAVVVLPLFLVLGAWWQNISRELVGIEPSQSWDYAGVFVVAAIVVVLVITLARGIRRVTDLLIALIGRVLPPPVSRGLAVVAVGVVLVFAVEGLLATGISRISNGSAAAADTGSAEGVERPSAPERSGSPESKEEWDTLGREGRTFVAGGPTSGEIASVTGRPALTPIRVYAGRKSVDADGLGLGRDTVDSLADRLVAELDRTGAFDREYLAIATTTGRGWVNASVASSLEYLAGGDTAIAAVQYSYLPSPLAFLADRDTPLIAGRAVFEAVYQRVQDRPESDRPKLLTFGESLGSYGGQDAFSGVQDMLARTDGALWVGTPNFSEQWSRVTDSRDPGSPEILPVIYGGQNVRFAAEPSDLDAPGLVDWESPRIVYWQHPSDPIVWWSFDLLFGKPDWLREPRGVDVDKGMTWIPLVTFWQVTLDMALAAEVPEGHGHAYGADAASMWAPILNVDDSELVDRVTDAMR